MDSDHEQKDPFWSFEEDYQVPVEEMEINVKDGKPKAINIRERDEEIIHVCDLCGRILIIGARSSDFQTEKVAGLDIKNRKEHFLGQPASDNAKMGYCYLCKKDLPSTGAHSDREWKGIQPPPQSLRSCSLNLSDYVDKNDEKKAESEKGYKCSICDISFPTLQGLGGHRSVHGKDKNRQEVGLIIGKNDEKVAEKKRYKCSICDLSFPTLKALSGHMDRIDRSIHKKDKNKQQFGLIIDKNDEKVAEKLYKCYSCDRSFSTYQGLGGHRKSHSKDMKRELATNINIASSADTLRIDEVKESNKTCPISDDGASPGEASQTGPRTMELDLNEPCIFHDQGIEKIN